MRRGGFIEDQISDVLREQEAGGKTAELCREHGISPKALPASMAMALLRPPICRPFQRVA
jgi:hypothetical protein